MKKWVLFAILLIASLGFALAEKIDVSMMEENFSPGENISFKVSLLDKDNNPIQAQVDILLQDAGKINEIQARVNSNELSSLDLKNKALSGFWRIIASYNSYESTPVIFSVESQETAKFEIRGDKLVIINTGNTPYIQKVQIVIGDGIGEKDISLEVGESTSFRLIAPDGVYNVRVSDGTTNIMKENVALSGNVVGILDEKLLESSSITGGIKPEKDSFIQNFKNNAVVYVFLLLVICAFILVVIERFYRRKMLGKSILGDKF